MEDQIKKLTPLTLFTVQTKAGSLFQTEEVHQRRLVKNGRRKSREANKQEGEEEPEKKFRKGLSEDLSLLNKLLAHFESMDPNIKKLAKIE